MRNSLTKLCLLSFNHQNKFCAHLSVVARRRVAGKKTLHNRDEKWHDKSFWRIFSTRKPLLNFISRIGWLVPRLRLMLYIIRHQVLFLNTILVLFLAKLFHRHWLMSKVTPDSKRYFWFQDFGGIISISRDICRSVGQHMKSCPKKKPYTILHYNRDKA